MPLRRFLYLVVGFLLVALVIAGFFFIRLKRKPYRCPPLCISMNFAGRSMKNANLAGASLMDSNLTKTDLVRWTPT